MAINKVGSKGIEDGSVATVDFAPGTVTDVKLNATQNLSSKTITLPNTSVTSGMLAGSVANAKLSNSSITVAGTAVALGASATVNNQFVEWQSKITSDGSTVTTMVAGRGYFVDNSNAVGLVKLPASAAIGDTIMIKDYAASFGTNKLTIQRNSHKIQGATENSEISTVRANVRLVYVDATQGWLYSEESNVSNLEAPIFTAATGGTVTESGDFKIHTFTGDGNFVVSQIGNAPIAGAGPSNVDYLVVAGGGGAGGGHGGGGGGGGYRTTFPSPGCNAGAFSITATTFPITVGAGGSGTGYNSSSSASGNNSVFSSITSAKGGGGGSGSNIPGGEAGGSGGGGNGGYRGTGGAGNTPPVSPPQGNNGGTSVGPGSSSYSGAGGGGIGGTGSNGGSNVAGCGGAQTTNSISGSPIGYSGGGGGGSGVNPSPGGTGGGPSGANGRTGSAGDGGAAGANQGGGGGGAGSNPGTGGNGGKGIVVIRYKFQ